MCQTCTTPRSTASCIDGAGDGCTKDPGTPLTAEGLDQSRTGDRHETEKPDQSGKDEQKKEIVPFAVTHKGATWKEDWTRTATEAVGELSPDLVSDALIPTDVDTLCAGYRAAGGEARKAFWALLMASIAYPESGYKTTTRFWEPTMGKYSEGLFQLSKDDGGHGPACNFKSNGMNILESGPNIRCAVRIMRNQQKKHRRIFPPTYYWSVLTTSKKEVVKEVFRSHRPKLGYCGS